MIVIYYIDVLIIVTFIMWHIYISHLRYLSPLIPFTYNISHRWFLWYCHKVILLELLYQKLVPKTHDMIPSIWLPQYCFVPLFIGAFSLISIMVIILSEFHISEVRIIITFQWNSLIYFSDIKHSICWLGKPKWFHVYALNVWDKRSYYFQNHKCFHSFQFDFIKVFFKEEIVVVKSHYLS